MTTESAATLTALMNSLVKKFPESFRICTCTNLARPSNLTPAQHPLWVQEIIRRTEESINAILDLCTSIRKLYPREYEFFLSGKFLQL